MARNDDLADLHPAVRRQFAMLCDLLVTWRETGKLHSTFRLFEGYRSPEDQRVVYDRATSKARPWTSAHQYGLAADFVAYDEGRWSWNAGEDWEGLRAAAIQCGLDCPITWDRCHVQSALWTEARAGMKRR